MDDDAGRAAFTFNATTAFGEVSNSGDDTLAPGGEVPTCHVLAVLIGGPSEEEDHRLALNTSLIGTNPGEPKFSLMRFKSDFARSVAEDGGVDKGVEAEGHSTFGVDVRSNRGHVDDGDDVCRANPRVEFLRPVVAPSSFEDLRVIDEIGPVFVDGLKLRWERGGRRWGGHGGSAAGDGEEESQDRKSVV